jgi:biofilm PGA synthesis N-glycosyltransferase PgaC
LAEQFSAPVVVLRKQDRQGKSTALNTGAAAATGDIIIFTDANGSLSPGSLRAITAPFKDARVGVVSGSKLPVGEGAFGGGESSYWRLENVLKEAEGVLGVTAGADGGIYAVRRTSFRPIPTDVYADDYWVPINALSQGFRVQHVSDARAVESMAQSMGEQFERRVRIAAGIWHVSLRHLNLADPRRGWTALAFVSHRVLRTLVVPLTLPLTLAASALTARRSLLARYLFAAQVLCWTGAALGYLTNAAWLMIPFQFAFANVAAVVGGIRQVRKRQGALWRQTRKGAWT